MFEVAGEHAEVEIDVDKVRDSFKAGTRDARHVSSISAVPGAEVGAGRLQPGVGVATARALAWLDRKAPTEWRRIFGLDKEKRSRSSPKNLDHLTSPGTGRGRVGVNEMVLDAGRTAAVPEEDVEGTGPWPAVSDRATSQTRASPREDMVPRISSNLVRARVTAGCEA